MAVVGKESRSFKEKNKINRLEYVRYGHEKVINYIVEPT